MCIEKGISDNAMAKIIGIGYATEILEHNVCRKRRMLSDLWKWP